MKFGSKELIGVAIFQFMRHNAGPFYAKLQQRKVMSEENLGQPLPAQGDQQVQVLLDERELKSMYSNAYRIHTAAEEVIIDFGFNMPNPNPQPGPGGQPQQQLLFKVTDRVIITYSNAKRLAISLTQLVKRFEQQFGDIPLQPGPRR